MNTSIATYLLAGALAASMAWNLRGIPQAPAPAGLAGGAATAGDCSAAIAALDLSADQRAALARWSDSACKRSLASEARARELAAELHGLLGAPEFDADKAHALAAEVVRVRGQALSDCIESVIEVRRVLTPGQLDELFQRCCAPARG